MKAAILLTSLIHRPARQLQPAKDRLLTTYADWRVGASDDEKRAYKTTDSILLTFDDYGTADQVARLLAILRRERIRAMFFVNGNWAAEHSDLLAQIAEAGHIIGNHTYSHADLLSLSDDEARIEIERGVHSAWLRPPRGRYNARVRELARTLGYRICYWSIDSNDWQGVPADAIARKVLSELHPGAVILFHFHAEATLAALPGLIAAIRERGYELCSTREPLWGPGR